MIAEGSVALVIGSSPYAGIDVVHLKSTMGAAHRDIGTVGHRNQDDGYGKTEGQLSELPEGDVDTVIDVNTMLGEPSEEDDAQFEAVLKIAQAETARRRAAE